MDVSKSSVRHAAAAQGRRNTVRHCDRVAVRLAKRHRRRADRAPPPDCCRSRAAPKIQSRFGDRAHRDVVIRPRDGTISVPASPETPALAGRADDTAKTAARLESVSDHGVLSCGVSDPSFAAALDMRANPRAARAPVVEVDSVLTSQAPSPAPLPMLK